MTRPVTELAGYGRLQVARLVVAVVASRQLEAKAALRAVRIRRMRKRREVRDRSPELIDDHAFVPYPWPRHAHLCDVRRIEEDGRVAPCSRRKRGAPGGQCYGR